MPGPYFVSDRRGAALGKFHTMRDAQEALSMLFLTGTVKVGEYVIVNADEAWANLANGAAAYRRQWRRDYEDVE